jgi:hypothetical protein
VGIESTRKTMVILRRYGWQIYLAGCVLSWPVFLWIETRGLPLAKIEWTLEAFLVFWAALCWPVAYLGLLVIVVAQWLHG